MSENAEENDANQSKFHRVVSNEPVTDVNELFDVLSKFLMKDKKRQLSTEYLDEKDQIASRLTWNNLRKVANSVLDDESPQCDPIPAWIDQIEVVVLDGDDENPSEYVTDEMPVRTKQESESEDTGMEMIETKIEPNNSDSPKNDDTPSKRDAKRAKKEAKEARKRERAEKRAERKAKKEAKKSKQEGKKRKRDDESGDE